MTIVNKLASKMNRNDETPNIELAHELIADHTSKCLANHFKLFNSVMKKTLHFKVKSLVIDY
ncbi:hypothetical protein [Peribacillus loiseleuriae]|uniref:Uncharacterized protein n=1 Tax=Peribacillus loiseleuriae TaxID=1679170 RepID=A0A0K9GQN3_9BACI|nr:hypothetical protein [Peribacillus loiseleuriae]KMY48572.1 hypothetical protein AC625_02790 [Peribacillus loiseleuriae]